MVVYIRVPLTKEADAREFPGGPVVRTQGFHGRGPASVPGRGTKILQAMQQSQKKRKKRGVDAKKNLPSQKSSKATDLASSLYFLQKEI